MRAFEDSDTANAARMKAMEKLLKDTAHKVESLSYTHNEGRDDYAPLITRFKSIMKHGGALLLDRRAC